jgi:guanylate kinase
VASGARTLVSPIQTQVNNSRGINDSIPPEQTTDPVSNAALQREAALTTKPDLASQITDTQRAAALIKVHPDDLPCGHLESTSIGNENLKTTGNIVVIITGPFGGGKDTIARELLNEEPQNCTKAILHTSRPMGNKETNGSDYYFVSRDEFIKMRDNNEFLSWNDLEPGFYGVSLKNIRDTLNSRKDVVAAVGPTVAKPLKQGLKIAGIPFVEVFVLPVAKESFIEDGGIDKAIEILRGRLRERNRGKTDETYIDLLMQRSRLWFNELGRFEHTVENANGNLRNATTKVKNLIEAKKIEYLSRLEDAELAKLSPQLLFLESGEIPSITLNTAKFKVNKNIAVIVTGPSGVGKDTIFKELGKELKFTEPLSHTTRPKRKGEEEGVNYYFVSIDEFKSMMSRNNFVEWVMVHNDQFYGKTVATTQKALDSGNDLVYALNTSAREYYKAIFKKFDIPHIEVFISPIPKEELERPGGIDKAVSILEARMRKRAGGETEAQIQGRLKVAREWLQEAKHYSHVVVNADGGLEDATRNLRQIILDKKKEVD